MMQDKMKNIFSIILIILTIVGMTAFLVGSVGGIIYQLTEFGKYIEFVIYDHWTSYLTYAGAGLALISFIIIEIMNQYE